MCIILQILSWEFCARHHEELLPQNLVAPQVLYRCTFPVWTFLSVFTCSFLFSYFEVASFDSYQS